jgi:hypothetical protein
VARLKKRTDAYSVLVGKPEGNRPLGRPGRRWEDNIKIDLKEISWEVVHWIDLVQDTDNSWDLVNKVMNLQFT